MRDCSLFFYFFYCCRAAFANRFVSRMSSSVRRCCGPTVLILMPKLLSDTGKTLLVLDDERRISAPELSRIRLEISSVFQPTHWRMEVRQSIAAMMNRRTNVGRH